MGINELWPASKDACQKVSLREIIAKARQNQSEVERQQPVPVGIDASIWIAACQAIAISQQLYVQKPIPVLETLFSKLAFLLYYPIHPHLVFDGADRPEVKRDKKVITTPNWVVKELKDLVPMFGFSWHDAPGEAEAELAAMNRAGYLHSVITTDSDTLVFQAPRIIRTDLDSSYDGDRVSVYELNDFQALGLTKGGLLLFALTLGGDYHKGLDGCGRETALGLCRAGFGDSLLKSICELTQDELNDFLVGWRNEIQKELLTNAHRHLPQRNLKAAAAIDASFPDLKVADAYLHPNISMEPYRQMPLHHEPSIPMLAQFCNRKLGWTAEKILTWSRNQLWSGVFSQMLYSALLVHEGSPLPLLRTPSLSVQLASISQAPQRKSTTLEFVHFVFSSRTLDELTGVPMEGRVLKDVKISIAKDFVPVFLHPQSKRDSKKKESKKTENLKGKGRDKQAQPPKKQMSVASSSRQQLTTERSLSSIHLPKSLPPLRTLSLSPSLPPPIALLESPSSSRPQEPNVTVSSGDMSDNSSTLTTSKNNDFDIAGPFPCTARPQAMDVVHLGAIDLTAETDGARESKELEEEEVAVLLMPGGGQGDEDDEVEYIEMTMEGHKIISLLDSEE